MAVFAGSPIYNVYLRLLGAKIGRNTVIQSPLRARSAPICISIGDNTILRKDIDPARLQGAVQLHPYRPDRDRRQRLRRRSERARHRHRDGGRHPARARIVAAERPARARRQALSRLARAGDDGRLLPDRAPRLHVAAALRSMPAFSSSRPRRCSVAAADHALIYWYPISITYTRRRRARPRRWTGAARLLAVAAGSHARSSSVALAIGLVGGLSSSRGCSTAVPAGGQDISCCYGFHYWVHRDRRSAPAIRGSTTCCSATAPSSSTT